MAVEFFTGTIQLITTSENARRLRSSVKSSRFLVYSVAPIERALKASKQSFTNAGNLLLRSDLSRRTLAKMPPAFFQWL
jgi:hypothetical protein